MPTIPSSLDDLTVEWLQEVLDARVERISVTPIAAGDGFVGQLARLAIGYSDDGADLPRSLIAKLPAANDQMRQIGTSFGLYERESRFYEELAPQIDLRTPKAYVNLREPESASFALLLEDLAPALQGDQIAGAGAELAHQVLVAIAGFHARWWKDSHLERVAEWCMRPDSPALAAATAMFEAAWPTVSERYADRVPSEFLGWAQSVGRELSARLAGQAGSPHTLLHGDFRLDNMMFFDDGTPAILDWQAIALGRPANEVAYFLVANVTPEVRRAHETDLLHAYFDAFAADARDPQSFDEFMDDFRRMLALWPALVVSQLGTLDPTNERGTALLEGLLERVVSATVDHDAGKYI